MDKIARIRHEIERLKETHERNLDKPMERGNRYAGIAVAKHFYKLAKKSLK